MTDKDQQLFKETEQVNNRELHFYNKGKNLNFPGGSWKGYREA